MINDLEVTESTAKCGCKCGSANEQTNTNTNSDITTAVQEHYSKIAEQAGSGAMNSCGVSDQLYTATELGQVTEQAVAASAGCGNPLGLVAVREGDTVLDIGSGGGIDCFLAARKVGDAGQVIGIDMTPKMVELARANAAKMGVHNVIFKLGKMEALPVQDGIVDLIISNCVIALAPDKDLVFDEAYRVLKPGGRIVIADMVFAEQPPPQIRASLKSWAECVAGADFKDDYLGRIRKAGFKTLELLEEREVDACELSGSADQAPIVLSITVKATK